MQHLSNGDLDAVASISSFDYLQEFLYALNAMSKQLKKPLMKSIWQ